MLKELKTFCCRIGRSEEVIVLSPIDYLCC